MKQLTFAIALLAGSVSFAQQPSAPLAPYGPSTPTITPEMWFYNQQMQRYDDPKEMVRRNAEFRAAGRRSRIARAKWMGFSKARPIAEHTPFTSGYTPAWVARPLPPVYWLQGRVSSYSATN